MPFTRITLRQDLNDEQIKTMSDILQQSLEAEFDVPPHDCFQVFETLPARLHVFDRHYKSGGRSNNFIQFHVLAGRPRSFTQKKNLCRTLCDRLNAMLGISPDDVMVIIQFNTADDWSFSNGVMLSGEGL